MIAESDCNIECDWKLGPRRNLTKGQQAMALARIYPEPEKGGRGKKSEATKLREARGFGRRMARRSARSARPRARLRGPRPGPASADAGGAPPFPRLSTAASSGPPSVSAPAQSAARARSWRRSRPRRINTTDRRLFVGPGGEQKHMMAANSGTGTPADQLPVPGCRDPAVRKMRGFPCRSCKADAGF
jgi:hypothetical protein